MKKTEETLLEIIGERGESDLVDLYRSDYGDLRKIADICDISVDKLRGYVFQRLSIPTQARLINEDKHKRRPSYLPRWVLDLGIDLDDEREVRQWKSIAFRSRYPYIKTEVNNRDTMSGQSVITDVGVIYAMVVTEIQTLADGRTIGQAVDTNTGLLKLNVEWVQTGVWKELE